MTPSELVMATQMVDYWTNFAHTGNPNKGPNPANTVWPQYSPTSRGSIMLATPVQPVYGFSKKICDWWDTQGYAWGY
jgi:carboxylesterase type B